MLPGKNYPGINPPNNTRHENHILILLILFMILDFKIKEYEEFFREKDIYDILAIKQEYVVIFVVI